MSADMLVPASWNGWGALWSLGMAALTRAKNCLEAVRALGADTLPPCTAGATGGFEGTCGHITDVQGAEIHFHVCTYIYIYMYTYMHTYIHTYIHTYMHTYEL